MKKIISVLLLCCGCASICNDMNKCSVSIKSNTPVKVVVKEDGDILCTKTTPCYVGLKGGKGFFRSEYEFEFSRNGYDTATYSRKGSLSGWTLGNVFLVFFAPLGVLVDAASGNLFKIGDEDLEVSLSRYANEENGSIAICEVEKDPIKEAARERAILSLYSYETTYKTTDETSYCRNHNTYFNNATYSDNTTTKTTDNGIIFFSGIKGNGATATTINGTTYYSDGNGNSGTATTINGTTYFSDNNGNSGTATTINGTTYYSDNNGNHGTATTINGTTYYSDSNGNSGSATTINGTTFYSDNNGNSGAATTINGTTYYTGY